MLRRSLPALAFVVSAALAFATAARCLRHAAPPPSLSTSPTGATPSVVAGAIGASFRVSQTGAAGYRIPIKVAPGNRGSAPQLALSYQSQGGDGMLGRRWALDGLSRIERCPASILTDGFRGGVGFDADDRFCLMGTGADDPRLINLDAKQASYFVPGAEYRTQKETWTRVVASPETCGGGPCSFQVWLKDGTMLGYGTQPDGQVAAVAAATAAPPPAGVIRTWLLNQRTDPRGNTVTITYTTSPPILGGGTVTSSGAAYPLRIDYTSRATAPLLAPMRSVQFFYLPRADATFSYQGGAQVQSSALLSTIQTCLATSPGSSVTGQACASSALPVVSQYELAYQQNPVTGQTQLASVTECDGGGVCFPPTTFSYSSGASGQVQTGITTTGLTTNQGWIADFNGDGRSDLLSTQSLPSCAGASGVLFFASATEPGFAPAPTCVSLPFAQAREILAGDFNGDGRADLLLAGTSSAVYYYGTGGFPASGTQVTLTLGDQTEVGDVNGDGLADVVTVDPDEVTVYLATPTGLGPGVPSALELAGTTWLVDVTGDGRADLFSLEQTTGTLYVSSPTGFAAPISIAGMPAIGDGAWIGDVTGDGLADFVTTDGSNAFVSASNGRGFQPFTTISGLALDQGNTWSADFNGDRWMDLYSAGTSSGTLYLATAAGFTAITTAGSGLTADATWIGDFNGDGAADLYAPATAGDTIYFAGIAGAVPASNQAPDLVTTIVDGLGGRITITSLPLTDPAVYAPQAALTSGQLDSLIAFQGLAYTPLSNVQVPLYPTIELQDTSYVVASHTRQNVPGVNGFAYTYSYAYYYQQALLDLLGRGWLGFTTTTVVDRSLGSQSTTWPRQDFPYVGAIANRADCAATSPVTPCALPAQGGKPMHVDAFVYRCEDVQRRARCKIPVTGYDPDATRLFQVLQTSHTEQDLTYGFTAVIDTDHDAYGNPIRIANHGDVQNTPHPLYTCASYLNDEQRWRIGYLERRRLTTAPDCGDVTTWHPGVDLRLGWMQYDGAMNVTAELQWDDEHRQWLGAAYTYDGLGNQLSDAIMAGVTPVAQPETRYTTAYDPVYRTFPVRRVTPAPDAKRPPLETRFAYDARFGTRVGIAEPTGAITNRCVDGFGRATLVQGPPPAGVAARDANCLSAGTYPYLDAAFVGNRALVTLSTTTWTSDAAAATVARQTRQRNTWSDPTWVERTMMIDGLGRTARAVTHDQGGGEVYVDREYLTESLTARTSQPYAAGETPRWRVERYDAAGRKTSATTPYQAPDGTIGVSETRWRYSAPNTITETRVVPGGADYVVASSFELFNRQQKTTRRVVVSDRGATSTFDYDALGTLIEAVSPAGAGRGGGVVTNTSRFDSLGRRLRYQETNTGWIEEDHDALGFLQETRDQAGQRVVFEHDELGRQVRRTAYQGGEVSDVVAFDWDLVPGQPADPLRRGHLARVSASDGAPYLTYTFDYDPAGNLIAREVGYPGVRGAEHFRFTAFFDPQRRLTTWTYPDARATTVALRYQTKSGYLADVAVGAQGAVPVPYLTYDDYTPFGAPRQVTYASGAGERWTFDVSDKPWSQTVYTAGGGVASSRVYGWDTLGNLIGTFDCAFAGHAGDPACQRIGVAGKDSVDLSVTLGYVSNRLTQAIGPYGDDGARGTIDYGYDGAGNLMRHDATAFTYVGHAVTRATRGGATVFAALYDAAGNMCLRATGPLATDTCPAPGTAPAGTTAYAFDPMQRMTAVWNGGTLAESYRYDDEDRRVLKAVMDADGQLASNTLYPDDSYRVTLDRSGAVTDRQLFLPGLRDRAMIMDGHGTVRALHQDLTLDTQLVTDDGGKVSSQIVFAPYGAIVRETPPGSAPRSALFQGAARDGTGLYQMGARYHDPGLGRFLSADRRPGDTYGQDALNRYAFTLNSPAVYVDPNGETPLLILTVIFQAIFDVLTDGAGVVLSAEEIASDIVGAGFREETAVYQLQAAARQSYTVANNGARAGDLAWEAATALRDAGVASGRAKLTVAITDNAIYADVSGAASEGDNLTGAGELSAQSRILESQAAGSARLGSNGELNSFETWGVRNCAEFRVCNRILQNGEQLTDVREMYTVDLRSWSEAPRCRNCVITSREVDRAGIESDRPGSFVRRQQLPYRVRTLSRAGEDTRGNGPWRGAQRLNRFRHRPY